MAATNFLVDAFYSPEPEIEKTNITQSEIKNIFLLTLDEFAISPEWIEEKQVDSNKDSTLNYKVRIPKDLPLLLVVNDLTKNFRDLNIAAASAEEKINGTTNFTVTVDENLRLKAKLLHNSNLSRPESQVSFIVEDTDELSERYLKELLDFGYPFGVMLIPSLENEIFKQEISEAGKNYVLILNDEIDDDKFLMEEGFAKKKISSAVSTIIKSFSSAKMFLVDENSDLYESAIFNFVEDEFKRRNIRIRRKTEFKSLNGISAGETESLFDFYKHKTDIPKTFFINAQNFLLLRDELITFRKKGNRIVKPS